MKQISTSICLGLGDNIIARMIFDSVKHEYDQIRISHDKNIFKVYRNNDPAYGKFINDIGNLLFTEPPYYFDQVSYTPIHTFNTTKNIFIPYQPNIQYLLCKGFSLNIKDEYIVVSTKVRGIKRRNFFPVINDLLIAIRILAQKYTIVIMGERDVEKSGENVVNSDFIYGIYDQLISAIPSERAVDLTVPALGIVAPDLSRIQQDAFIMQEAKFVITLGIGGNTWLAATSSNRVVGFRDAEDNDLSADILMSPKFSSLTIFKRWNEFINYLKVM